MAKHLDMDNAVELLPAILAAEKGADEKLSALAERGGVRQRPY